jgi:hypothetical protein
MTNNKFIELLLTRWNHQFGSVANIWRDFYKLEYNSNKQHHRNLYKNIIRLCVENWTPDKVLEELYLKAYITGKKELYIFPAWSTNRKYFYVGKVK